MNSLDIFVQNYFSLARTPFITEFMYILTTFFDVTNFGALIRFVVMVFCVAILIYLVRNIKYSILFVLTIFCGAVVTYLLKIFFNISRPLGSVIVVSGQSFPSYHATVSTIFFVMLMYIFDSHFKSLGRIIFNSLCVTGIILISLSRVYLGVHWLSDIIGGIVLGVIISYISIKIFKYFLKYKK